MKRPGSTEARFFAKVKFSRGCWLWMGSKDENGYGRFMVDGKQVGAHRYAVTLMSGPIPYGHHVDHLCRNTSCVRPDHLEAVPQRTNTMRGMSPGAVAARATCKAMGHQLVPAAGGHGIPRCLTCERFLPSRVEFVATGRPGKGGARLFG